VRDRTELKIANVRYIEEVATDGEYRGGELPAWQINLVGDEQAVVYVGALSGKIRAVRTQPWRWFDFLWSLHIMDYEEREDFNHLLIQVMASLSLLTVLSGLALFLSTQRWPVKR